MQTEQLCGLIGPTFARHMACRTSDACCAATARITTSRKAVAALPPPPLLLLSSRRHRQMCCTTAAARCLSISVANPARALFARHLAWSVSAARRRSAAATALRADRARQAACIVVAAVRAWASVRLADMHRKAA